LPELDLCQREDGCGTEPESSKRLGVSNHGGSAAF
jgi:hypothetical protein